MARKLNFGPGKGNGKLIKIRGEIPGLALLGNSLPDALSLTFQFDRIDLLEGNLLRIQNKRYWIAAREPAVPAARNTTVTVELRRDTSTRGQRRRA